MFEWETDRRYNIANYTIRMHKPQNKAMVIFL